MVDDTDTNRIAAELAAMKGSAYKNGWQDALRAVMQADSEMLQEAGAGAPTGQQQPHLFGLARAGQAVMPKSHEIVLSTIRENPGLLGVELIQEIKRAGHTILERTARTALYRLKIAGQIVNHDSRWYPAEQKPPTKSADFFEPNEPSFGGGDQQR